MLRREHGVLESTLSSGTEIRLHAVKDTVVRVPWHKDPQSGEWYSGIEGPPIKISAIFCVLEIPAAMKASDGRYSSYLIAVEGRRQAEDEASFACRLLPVMAAGAEFVVCCLACSKSTPFDADKVRIGRGGEIERGPKGSTS